MKIFVRPVIVLLLALVLYPGTAYCMGNKVAVFPFKNNGQPQYSGLSSGISAMLTTDLSKSKSIEVVDPQQISAALGSVRLLGGAPSVDDALKAARTLQADYAVTGEFIVFGNKFRIDLRIYDVAAGTLKSSEKAQAKEEELFDLVDGLSDKTIQGISGIIPVAGGSLRVESVPPGAYILIDGDKAGQTPATLKDVAPGMHKIELDLDGYKPYKDSVLVKEREAAKVEAKLIRLYGGIRVWWKQYPDSDVSVGGEVVRISQFQYNILAKYCRNLPADTYTVSVRMPYKDEAAWDNTRTWKTYTAEVEINAGEVTDIYLDNNLYSPGLEVGSCGSCAANWDFNTDIIWYEHQ